MNKKKIVQFCCAALVASGIGLNIQNAILDYGLSRDNNSILAAGTSNPTTWTVDSLWSYLGYTSSNDTYFPDDSYDESMSTVPGPGSHPTGSQQREVLLGAGMYVTEVTGEASGSVHVGMRISNGVAAELKGKIKAEKQDEYKINCHPDGSCPCTAQDWHMCASGGCPKEGFGC